MKCPKCGGWMVINEWEGWYWGCLSCNYEGRKATNKEVEEQENELYGEEEND